MDSDGAVVAEQRRRLAMLVLIAAGRGQGVSRDKLVALLSPESSSESARHSLHQLLYYVRQQAGDDVLLGTDPLRLNPAMLACDAVEFEDALDRGDLEAAVRLYRGPFLDGFHLPDSNEFETWSTAERSRLAGRYGDALASLAAEADARGDHGSAIDWWKRLAVLDPIGGRSASGLIRALAAAGDIPAALRYAATHEALIRDELGSAMAPELAAFVDSLRRAPPPPSPNGAEPLPEVAVPPPPSESLEPAAQSVAPATGLVPPPSRRWPPTVGIIAALAIALALVVFGRPRAEGATAPDLIAILPFQVASSDPATDWRGDGLVNLLAIHLTDDGGRGTADDHRAVAAGLGITNDKPGALPLPIVLKAARDVGASWAITGSGVRTNGDLLLTVDVVDVPAGRVVGRVSARGHRDSVARLADTLAARVVVLQGGDNLWSGTALPTTSVPAIRAYQRARRALDRNDWALAAEEFAEALRRDSTFASAALGLRLASGLRGGPGRVAAESIAYLYRDRLTARERDNFLAELGPGYPDRLYPPADRLTAWRALVSRDPSNAEAWFHLGLIYYHVGNRIDQPDALEEGRIALERALDRGTIYEVVARLQLQAIAGVTADSALLERVFDHAGPTDATGPDAIWRRWLRAFTRRDTTALAAVRPMLRDATHADLSSIWRLTQRVGFAVGDAIHAVEILAERARTADELSSVAALQYPLALNRGRPLEAQVAARRIVPEWRPLSRLAVQALSAMYGDGDSAAGSAAARELAVEVTRPLATDAAELRSQRIHVCISAQWSLQRGATGDVEAALQKLRTPEPGADPGIRWFYSNCALTLEAWRSVIEGRPNARALVSELDSLQRRGSGPHWALPEHRVTAQLWIMLGEPAAALRAIRRKQQEAISYLATDLRIEGDIALRVGDVAGAIAAWRHHLALRVDPEESMRAATDSVRMKLDILEARKRRWDGV